MCALADGLRQILLRPDIAGKQQLEDALVPFVPQTGRLPGSADPLDGRQGWQVPTTATTTASLSDEALIREFHHRRDPCESLPNLVLAGQIPVL